MNMPQMPFMPSKSSSGESDGVADSLSSPSTEGSVAKAAESDVDLDIPSHIEEDPFKKPSFNHADENDQTHTIIPLAPKKGIEVVAERKGFYNQCRYKEGDKFLVKSEQDLGDWMKCVDPVLEKKRVEFLKSKKAKK